MPPPFFQLGKVVHTKSLAQARLCLKRGYKKIVLPPGRYCIADNYRNEELQHVPEASDGYTYRLASTERNNPYYSKRISIWQNDLADAVYCEDEEK